MPRKFILSTVLWTLGATVAVTAISVSCAEPAWPLRQEDGPAARRPEPGRLAGVSEALAADPEGRTSAVVLDNQSRLVFGHAIYERYELASVAKVYILLAYLDRLSREGREPSPDELESMRSMIVYSDNASATSLFSTLGGVDGINAFLHARSLQPLEPAYDGSWGSMTATPLQVGELMTSLYRDHLLDATSSTLALSLLASVIEEQSWGVGRAADGGRGGIVYFKNGWLPTQEGWIVHSIGLLSEGSQRYVLVFMTDQKQTFESAVATIENAVALTRAGLFPASPTPAPSATREIRPTPEGTPRPALERTPSVTPEVETTVPRACATAQLGTPRPGFENGPQPAACP